MKKHATDRVCVQMCNRNLTGPNRKEHFPEVQQLIRLKLEFIYSIASTDMGESTMVSLGDNFLSRCSKSTTAPSF